MNSVVIQFVINCVIMIASFITALCQYNNKKDKRQSGIFICACIFRKNRALAPHERSAVPLGTDHCPVG